MDVAIVTMRLVEFDAMSNFTMATAIALKGYGKVSLYTFAYERPIVEGIDIHLLGNNNSHSMGTNFQALMNTFKLARELSKYDILIIVNPDVGSMPAHHLARRYNPKLKVVWTFHGLTPISYINNFRDRMLMRIRKAFYIPSMKRADRIQVFSNYIKKEICDWGIDKSNVMVIPFGINIKNMTTDGGLRIREKYGISDRFLCLYVGRLVNSKHVDELIKAISLLEKPCLMVVGEGPEKERLIAQSKKLNVQNRVLFAGRVPDNELPYYYAACDVWVTASRHEGFCVPIVEAMAAGKPVIIPNVTAMPETAGDVGLTYNSGDIEGLVERLQELFDKEYYNKLSRKALDRASAFDMSSIIDRYIRFVMES